MSRNRVDSRTVTSAQKLEHRSAIVLPPNPSDGFPMSPTLEWVRSVTTFGPHGVIERSADSPSSERCLNSSTHSLYAARPEERGTSLKCVGTRIPETMTFAESTSHFVKLCRLRCEMSGVRSRYSCTRHSVSRRKQYITGHSPAASAAPVSSGSGSGAAMARGVCGDLV